MNSIRSRTDREVLKYLGDVDASPSVSRCSRGWTGCRRPLCVHHGCPGDHGLVPRDAVLAHEASTLLAFLEYLAEHAAGDARSNAADPFEIDIWTLHSGATYALTHFFRGKEGEALDGYVRTANDILFNPDGTIERVEQEYEQQAEAETDADGQTSLESQVALAQIEQVSADVREKAATFEEHEEALRERFATANAGR
jgi:hypothetical protein